MENFLVNVVLSLILVFSLTSYQSAKETIKEIKDSKKVPLKILGPSSVKIKIK